MQQNMSKKVKAGFDTRLVFLDVMIAFAISFAIVGIVVLDVTQRALVTFPSRETVQIGAQGADFDPGIQSDGNIAEISKDKLNSLFNNIK